MWRYGCVWACTIAERQWQVTLYTCNILKYFSSLAIDVSNLGQKKACGHVTIWLRVSVHCSRATGGRIVLYAGDWWHCTHEIFLKVFLVCGDRRVKKACGHAVICLPVSLYSRQSEWRLKGIMSTLYTGITFYSPLCRHTLVQKELVTCDKMSGCMCAQRDGP